MVVILLTINNYYFKFYKSFKYKQISSINTTPTPAALASQGETSTQNNKIKIIIIRIAIIIFPVLSIFITHILKF